MKLSIVTASRNETAMLVMTVLSAIEEIKHTGVDAEVFVVDNSDHAEWVAVQALMAGIIKSGFVRLVHEENPSIAVALERAHTEARGDLLFYTDAHCLIGTGTIKALLAFEEQHRDDPLGLVFAPIQWAHCSKAAKRTHFGLSKTLLGDWSGVAAVTEPQKVTWKGMPYLIRKSTWVAIGGMGCCAKHSLGWGVMRYIGIKPWMLGFENWAIPDGVVYHFGEWPDAAKAFTQYRTYKTSGRTGLGLAVASYVFGGEELFNQQFTQTKGFKSPKTYEALLADVKKVAEDERQWMLAHQKWSFMDLVNAAPWGPMEMPTTISPEYLQLNSDLHSNSDVLYGYKGCDQMESVKRWAGVNRCRSILDYGAGKQTLSAALRANGCKDVRDYDPAVPAISAPPEPADMVVCTDVLEHVEPEFLDKVLDHLASLTRKVSYLRICGVPCTSKTLPDGSDPHRIVQSQDWWLAKLSERFRLDRTLESSEKYFTFLMKPLS